MYFEIKQIIFTDETKDGKKLVSQKTKEPFFMLHLEVIEWDKASIESNQHGKWISKYYTEDKWNSIKEKIKVWNLYNIEYKVSWIYKNIVSVRDKDNNIII